MDAHGKLIYKKKFGRNQLADFILTLKPRIAAIESCPGSQFWGRRLRDPGHTVRIIAAQFVKPYRKSNKNDFNDAEAIAEAGSRGGMRFVALKTTDPLELQALHRVRQRLIVKRTAVVNQMRAL